MTDGAGGVARRISNVLLNQSQTSALEAQSREKTIQALRRRKRRTSAENNTNQQPDAQQGRDRIRGVIRSLERDLKRQLHHIEKKIDFICYHHSDHHSATAHAKDAELLPFRHSGTTPNLGGLTRSLSCGLSDDGKPKALSARRPAGMVNCVDSHEPPRLVRSSTSHFRLPPLDTDLDTPSAPSALHEAVNNPPGIPAWLEPSPPWTPQMGPLDSEARSFQGKTSGRAGNVNNSSGPCNRRESCSSSKSSHSVAMRIAKVATARVHRGPISHAIWQFMEEAESSTAATIFSWVCNFLIVVNVLFCVLQSAEPPMFSSTLIMVAHFLFDCMFSVEVFIRFLVCPHRCYFFMSFSNWVDMVAAFPLVLSATHCIMEECNGLTMSNSMLVILPVLRLCKMLRSFEKFHLLLNAFGMAFEALPVLLYTLGMIVLFFSSVIYLIEPRSNIGTLPDAMWLTIVTMTTVGYGDTVPKSSAGVIVVSALIIGSALYMAIPLGIVGGSFSRVWEDRDRLVLIRRTRLRLLQCGYKPKDILELFYAFDRDKSGELDLAEFNEMITEMQLGINPERVVNLFKTFDADGSGKVDDEEFVRTLFPKDYQAVYASTLMTDLAMKRSSIQSKEALATENLRTGTPPASNLTTGQTTAAGDASESSSESETDSDPSTAGSGHDPVGHQDSSILASPSADNQHWALVNRMKLDKAKTSSLSLHPLRLHGRQGILN